MDALPVKEETALPFTSIHPGYMHACGHDGHMTMNLLLAKYLADHPNEKTRSVLLVFNRERKDQEVQNHWSGLVF